jgi:hypothetical protein
VGQPFRLTEFAPPPTGVTRQWVVSPDVFREATELLQRIVQYQRWDMHAEAENLREHLRTLPGFPHMDEGDHIEVREQKPVSLLVRPRL